MFVKFHDVSFKTGNYFQSVFVLCAKTPDLIACRESAAQEFELEPNGEYMPHVSLVYADLDEAQLKAVAEEAVHRLYRGEKGMESELLAETGFWAEDIELWEIDINDKLLETWNLIEKVGFLSKE